MNFSDIPLFNIFKLKMDYLSQRQSVLAQNVANADTPNYRAKDVAAPDFGKLVQDSGSLRMAVTSPAHLSGPGGSDAYAVIQRATTAELNPSGNNVSIEDEMALIGQNQMEYQKVLNLYSKAVTLFKTAIGNPNNGG